MAVADPRALYDGRFSAGYQSELASGYDQCVLAAVRWALQTGGRRLSGPRILDYGCGQGRFLTELAAAAPGASVTGADLSPVALELAAECYPGARFLESTVEGVPAPDRSFDLIAMLDVLEHVRSAPGTAAELHRLLCPGGLAVITTPCASRGSIPWLFNLLTDGFEATPDGYGRYATDEPAHLRRLSVGDARGVLAGAGLRPRAFRFWGHGFTLLADHLPALSQPARHRLAMIDWRLMRRIPVGGAMVVVAERPLAPVE